MKISVQIARIIVGVLFVFSGIVKAIDPLGLTYKMQEFFEVWKDQGYAPDIMLALHNYAFLFSIIMIVLEVVLGVALLVGYKKKLTLRLLLLLMLLFTFLTSYVLFSGKIRTCGCFGDCIPLTPIQTFTKDIVLLVMIIFMLLKNKYIQPLFKELLPLAIVLVAFIGTCLLLWNVYEHLPIKDCLPYKAGNDILALRKMPADAVQDEFSYVFIYEKAGQKKEFTKDFPDSTWAFVDRKATLVKKGKNNVPLINDFSLSDKEGADSTETILNKPAYYLLFVQDADNAEDKWMNSFTELYNKAKKDGLPIYVVTSNKDKIGKLFNKAHDFKLPIYTCDGTAIKTAARANPTIFFMKGPVVQKKYSWADFEELK
jgi:uncharacterized membrane protein YphA (DoxX/SURF4 family)